MSAAGDVTDQSPASVVADQASDAIKSPNSQAASASVTQSLTSPLNQLKQSAPDDAVGHDSSHSLQLLDSFAPAPSAPDSTAAIQRISDNREPSYTRQEPTTSQIRQVPENSAIASLKHEHSSRTQSPLRESSVPVLSTEMAATTAQPAPPKRSHKKKGVAAAAVTKRTAAAAPAKRSHKKKIISTAATPAQSSPAPRSIRTASSPARSLPDADGDGPSYSGNEEEEDGEPVSDNELYCICRKPDTGTFMIGCDGGCDDWFHGKCVNIGERWKGLIDKFICPFCEEKGVGETTWKRMCRRNDCGMPAMVSKGTKFCSEKCGELFMHELVHARTRQVTEATSKSKKGGQQTTTQDLGARGGLISLGELKALLNAAPTLEQFKRLGDGSISPGSSSPKADATAEDDALSHESALNDIERERIEQITALKTTARFRHALLKDKAVFVAMVKNIATRLAEHRNLKPKELCGFDVRLAWTEDEFQVWRASAPGQEALRIGSLPLPLSEDKDGDSNMSNNTQSTSDMTDHTTTTCTKRKCQRHHDWAKLYLEDTTFEIRQNASFMHALETEEAEIVERARLRAREIRAGGVAGTVEFHDVNVVLENKEDRALGVRPVVEHPRDVEMEGLKEEEEEEEEEEGTPGGKVEGAEVPDVKAEVEEDDNDNDDEVDMVDAIAATV